MKFTIKKGDTLPLFKKTLYGSDGILFENLDDISSVKFIMTDYAGTEKVNYSASLDDSTGEVTYTWQSGDTDTKGEYKAELQATYDDGSVRTCPQDSYWYVNVKDDLGD